MAGNDEFGVWAASFNEMARRCRRKIEALSEAQRRERAFTANVAHELRTPLTALVGEAQLLVAHAAEMPDEARRLAELLVRGRQPAAQAGRNLLEISRIDSGVEATEPSWSMPAGWWTECCAATDGPTA